MSAPTSAPWEHRATHRASFATLVRVEAGKLAGSRSDKVLLAFTVPLVVGVAWLMNATAGAVVSAYDQLQPLLLALPLGQVLVMSAVIKLVAGEWHYRSVQPALLQQPSRIRFLLAQLVVVSTVVVLVSALQAVVQLVLLSRLVADADAQNHVLARPWWAVGVTVAMSASLLLVVYALALLVPNTPTALTLYLVSVLVLFFVRTGLPVADQWFDPSGVAVWWAQHPRLGSPWPSVVAVVLLVVALLVGIRSVVRRDAG